MPELTGFALLRQFVGPAHFDSSRSPDITQLKRCSDDGIDLGALGYVLKDSATTDIIGAIRAAAAGSRISARRSRLICSIEPRGPRPWCNSFPASIT